jgi:hypothetical protein
MGMRQRRDRARLGLESCASIGTFGQLGVQQFDGDGSVQSSVASLVDLTHPADAEQRDDLVGSEPSAGR